VIDHTAPASPTSVKPAEEATLPRRPRHLTRAVAGALTVTALAAPAAVARPVDAAPGATASPPASVRSDAAGPAPTVIRPVDDGFDWGSAGMGAAAAAAIVLLSLGGVRAGSRVRVRPAP
jgi:hypothetical protein